MEREWKRLWVPGQDAAVYQRSSTVPVEQSELTPVGYQIFEERNRKITAERKRRQKILAHKQFMRNKHKLARVYSPIQLLVYAMLLFVMALSGVNLLMESASSDANKSTLSSLQSEYQRMSSDNDVLEASILAGIDTGEIYRYATKVLKMYYPGQDQIIQYKRLEMPYVRQEHDIP